jgi:hypothetical protein
MPLRRTVVVVGLFSALTSSAQAALAQDPGAAARVKRLREIMSPMAALAGQWEGDGRVSTGPGRPLVVRQTEDIVWGSGRTVLFIRGTGFSTDAATKDSVVFEAAAVAWADAQAGKVRMRAYRDGLEVDANIAIRGDTIEWGFPVPGGRVRYVIALTADTWHEVGHFVPDGGGEFPVVELKLRRKR